MQKLASGLQLTQRTHFPIARKCRRQLLEQLASVQITTMSKSVMLFMITGQSTNSGKKPGKWTATTHHLFACAGLQASDSAALAGFQSLPASSSDQPEKENCSIAGEGDDQQAAAELPCNKRQKRTPKEIKSPRPPKSQSEAAAGAYSPPDIRPPPEPTEYAKNRPRR